MEYFKPEKRARNFHALVPSFNNGHHCDIPSSYLVPSLTGGIGAAVLGYLKANPRHRTISPQILQGVSLRVECLFLNNLIPLSHFTKIIIIVSYYPIVSSPCPGPSVWPLHGPPCLYFFRLSQRKWDHDLRRCAPIFFQFCEDGNVFFSQCSLSLFFFSL